MSALASTSVRRTAASLTLLGAGFAFAGGTTAWAATPTTAPATCGTPAHPALYRTVHHDAVPAGTHVSTTKIDGPGTPEGDDWTASGTTETIEDAPARTEYQWQRTVVDQPASPGAPATPAVTHDETVVVTPASSEVVIDSPAVDAVPEVSHVDTTYVDGDGTPHGDGWTASGTTETIEDAPAWTEYEWQRTVVDQPASPGAPATPAVTHDETVVVTPAWSEVVIDSPAVPARPEVSHTVTVVDAPAWSETLVAPKGYAYVQKLTGDVRYLSSSSWNGQENDHGSDFGWFRTASMDKTLTVVHPAVTHEETVVDSPAVAAVPEKSHVVKHEAVTETRTVIDTPAVPAVDPVEEVSHPETAWTSGHDAAPEGEGWTPTGNDRLHPAETHLRYEWTRTVVDTPAVPAWNERVLLADAVAAGQPCAGGTFVVGAPAKAAVTRPAVNRAAVAHPAVARAAVTRPTATAETLAQTGLDLRLPLGAGIALVFVGGALVAARRVGAA